MTEMGQRHSHVILSLVLCGVVVVSAACASARPRWVQKPPEGYANDYFVGSGVGESRDIARNSAVSSAVARFAEGGTLSVRVSRIDSSKVTERSGSASTAVLDRLDQSVQEIITTGESPSVRGLRLHEEFTEQQGERYESWVLLRVPKRGKVRPVPSKGGFTARSALVPGWGQYAMGREGRGFAIGFTALALVPTAASFTAMRQENLTRARSTQIQASRTYYVNQANRYGSFKAVALSALAAVWGYSVIDAAASTPRLFVTVPNNGYGVGIALALSP